MNIIDKFKKGIVDFETGEIQYALVPIRSKHLGGFFMAMQEGFTYLAQLNLTQEQMRVLMLMMGKLDFENWIRVSQADMAKELGMQRSNVSRAIKALLDNGIIHKGPKVGNSWTYRLDPHFGWKGRASKKKAAEKAIREAQKKGLTVIDGGAS